MLSGWTIVSYSTNHTKDMTIPFGRNAEMFSVSLAGSFTEHYALKS